MKQAISNIFIFLVCVSTFVETVHAVCLDPETHMSGYRIPTDKEIIESRIITIGEVIKTKYLQEDPLDPDGITATIFTIQISKRLKGDLPNTIVVRNENDSGRYVMDIGEKHLFFLYKEGLYYKVDSCGNSSQLPQGINVLERIENILGISKKLP